MIDRHAIKLPQQSPRSRLTSVRTQKKVGKVTVEEDACVGEPSKHRNGCTKLIDKVNIERLTSSEYEGQQKRQDQVQLPQDCADSDEATA